MKREKNNDKAWTCWNRLELVDMNFNIGFKSGFQELVISLPIRHAPTKNSLGAK